MSLPTPGIFDLSCPFSIGSTRGSPHGVSVGVLMPVYYPMHMVTLGTFYAVVIPSGHSKKFLRASRFPRSSSSFSPGWLDGVHLQRVSTSTCYYVHYGFSELVIYYLLSITGFIDEVGSPGR